MWLKIARASVCLVKVYTVQSNEVKRKKWQDAAGLLELPIQYSGSEQSGLAGRALHRKQEALREVSSLRLDV